MQIQEVIKVLEHLAPSAYQESYDNSGLLTGNKQNTVSKILLTLDCTESVVEEAVQQGCNLIVAHHPILFKPLKKITGSNYIERVLLLAIRSNIALFAIHTNLDNVSKGVNFKIADLIGLQQLQVLAPREKTLKKLITFVPQDAASTLLHALHVAGAGNIGNYRECSFTQSGIGTFKPNEQANPYSGEANKLNRVAEEKIEVIFPTFAQDSVLNAMLQVHPYEVPAFDVIALDNTNPEVGSGMMGELPVPLAEKDFFEHIRHKLGLSLIRHSPLLGKTIEKVALCGGSGSFLLTAAKKSGAQVFISSDFKYHEFFDADSQLVIADINHYEAEVCTKQLLNEYLCEKLPNIATVLSNIKTNPISYF